MTCPARTVVPLVPIFTDASRTDVILYGAVRGYRITVQWDEEAKAWTLVIDAPDPPSRLS